MLHDSTDERGPYVLYVDDDESNLIVLSAALSHQLPTLTAQSAEQGLRLLQQHEIAVLLTDQRMPGQSGVELLATARRISPHTVRMLVTAYTNLQTAIDAINEGRVRRYIHKPWTAAQMVATLRDAYEVYQTESALRTLEKRLLETERYYALGVVAAGIAHELRNPATWVDNSLTLSRRRIGGLRTLLKDPNAPACAAVEELDRIEKLIVNAAEGSSRIVDIVRSVESSTRGQPNHEPVELGPLVETTLRMVEAHFGRNVRIERAGEGWPTITGSRTALGQVIANVVVNAAQAVESLERGLVTLRPNLIEDQLVVDVTDNGSGIPEDALPHIFDPFFTSKQQRGTGLGLAISRRIAQEHGGDLTAENLPGGGARFRLRLPLR